MDYRYIPLDGVVKDIDSGLATRKWRGPSVVKSPNAIIASTVTRRSN